MPVYPPASGGGTTALTIAEVDGSPSITANTLVLPNASLTDSGGGTATYTPVGGGGSVTFLDEGSAVGTGAILNFAGAGITATYAGGTVTATVGGTAAINFIVDGGGTVITTGVKGYVQVPFAWTNISAVRMLGDQSGSAVVDIWKDTYANYPPVDADSITASAPPTLAGAAKSEDSTLTGWTKTGSAGDILGFNVDSASTVTRLTVALLLVKA